MARQAGTADAVRTRRGTPKAAALRGLAAVTVAVLAGVATGLVLSGPATSPPPRSGSSVAASPRASAVVTLPLPTASADDSSTDREAVNVRRSESGAVDAAASYATILARIVPLDAEHARCVVANAASDAARPAMLAAVDEKLVPLQQQAAGVGGPTRYRQSVLATRLDSYSADTPATVGTARQATAAAPDRASVYVWTLLTIAQSEPVAESSAALDQANAIGSFSTTRLDLVWERGDWRINDSTTVDGPTPLIDGFPSAGEDLDTQLLGFRDWRPM